MRNDARLRAMVQEGPSLFGNGQLTNYAKRKKSQRGKFMKGDDLAVVTVNLPRLECEGRTFEPCAMRIKSTKNHVERVCVEFTSSNLEYIRAGLLTQGSFLKPRRRHKPSVASTRTVKWHNKRKAYVVSVMDEESTVRYLTVKPKTMDECDVLSAQALGAELCNLSIEEARRRAQESRAAAADAEEGDDDGPEVCEGDVEAFGGEFDDSDKEDVEADDGGYSPNGDRPHDEHGNVGDGDGSDSDCCVVGGGGD